MTMNRTLVSKFHATRYFWERGYAEDPLFYYFEDLNFECSFFAVWVEILGQQGKVALACLLVEGLLKVEFER